MKHFLKFQGDYLFDGNSILPGDYVLICDEAGDIINIVKTTEAGDDVQKFNGLLSPGFINCHCHLELSHMKGLIPEHTGLVDFVSSVMALRHFPEDEILAAIKVAEEGMIKNGIVAVGDITNTLFTSFQKQQQNLDYYNFVEASGWIPAGAAQRFSTSLNNYNLFCQISPTSFVPHAPYSVSAELWNLLKPYYKNKVVSIHNQETRHEDNLFLNNSGDFLRMYELMKLDVSHFEPTGKTSLQSYFNRLNDAANIVLVHNTFTSIPDVEFANNSGSNVFYCLCINANQYIENALPPIEMLMNNNCRIALGTDSLASNHSLSILDEMKTIEKHFPEIPVEKLLLWATKNGAEALQFDSKLGSFEKGKKPGVVLLENFKPIQGKSLSAVTVKKLL